MATTFQGSRVLDDYTFGSAQDIVSSYTVGGHLVASVLNNQRFLFTITLEMDVKGRKGLTPERWAHRLSQGVTPFFTPAPVIDGVTPPTGEYVVAQDASRRDTAIRVRRVSGAQAIPKLALFTIAGQNKLYMADQAINATAAPAGVEMAVFPPLKKATSANAALNFATPMARVVYSPRPVIQLTVSRGVDSPTWLLEEALD